MRRRPRVLACAVALAHLNISCVAHTTRPIVPMDVKPAEELEIIGAVKTSGERFQFPDDSPARVRNGALCATEAWSVQLHVVPRSQVQSPASSEDGTRIASSPRTAEPTRSPTS